MSKSNRYLILAFLAMVITVYCLLFYAVFTPEKIQDFASFYSAILNMLDHKNPYLQSTSLRPNLSPPFALLFFSFLGNFSYKTALIIWFFLSLILGLIGAFCAFYHAFSGEFLRKNWLILTLIYLSFFSTIANIIVVQFGSILLFFIMIGYHFYLRSRDLIAGVLWGIIIAFKFFPALLFFFVIKQGRKKVFFLMFFTFLIVSLLPFFSQGQLIYKQYFAMIAHVSWYGDNWNASLFGYLVRLFFHGESLNDLKILYLILFCISLIWYFKNLKGLESNHQPFCLTLTMMLLLSPFGWLYFFPLLVLPLSLTWIAACDNKSQLFWLCILLLINLPQGYIFSTYELGILVKVSFISCYFYGLLLLNYSCVKQEKSDLIFDEKKQLFLLITLLILAFGLLEIIIKFFLEHN